MNNFQIEIPEGYEIDTEKSSLKKGKIVFKELEKKLPRSWKELELVGGYYINPYAEIIVYNGASPKDSLRDVWPTEEEAKAALALSQLLQLRNAWGGWNRTCERQKSEGYSIMLSDVGGDNVSCFLFTFENEGIRRDFQRTFKDLLEEAKPLLT